MQNILSQMTRHSKTSMTKKSKWLLVMNCVSCFLQSRKVFIKVIVDLKDRVNLDLEQLEKQNQYYIDRFNNYQLSIRQQLEQMLSKQKDIYLNYIELIKYEKVKIVQNQEKLKDDLKERFRMIFDFSGVVSAYQNCKIYKENQYFNELLVEVNAMRLMNRKDIRQLEFDITKYIKQLTKYDKYFKMVEDQLRIQKKQNEKLIEEQMNAFDRISNKIGIVKSADQKQSQELVVENEMQLLEVKKVVQQSHKTNRDYQISIKNVCHLQSYILISNQFEEIDLLKKILKIELNLQHEQLGKKGMHLLCNSFQKLENVVQLVLNLNNQQIGDQYIFELGKSIKNWLGLQQLQMYLSNNNLTSDGLIPFSENLKTLINIQNLTLTLNNNKLDCQGLINLSKFIQNYLEMQQLDFQFNCNQIQFEGIDQFQYSLQKLVNLEDLKLDLSGNQIGRIGIVKMMQSLKQLNKVQKLSLKCNDSLFDSECMENLRISLPCCINNFELGLNDTQINDESMVALKEMLTKLDLKVLSLDLNDNSIKTEGMPHLCQGIQNLGQLKNLTLYLYNSRIGNQGVQHLSKMLENSYNLQKLTLYLSLNQINSQGLEYLTTSLQKICFLTQLSLYIYNNEIGNQGAKQLADCLYKMKYIKQLTIYMKFNKVGMKQIDLLNIVIQSLPVLSHLKFMNDRYTIVQVGREQILKALRDEMIQNRS